VRSSRALSSLARDQRGTATVEYALVLALLCTGACLAIALLAPLFVRLFLYQQALLLLPFP
jgi:Flp pilus assembly protein TadG